MDAEGCSGFAQDAVQGPASEDMGAWASAVGQNVLIRAASFFQGVRKHGHTVEVPLAVDALGQLDHRAIVPCQHDRAYARRTPEIAKDATEHVGLDFLFVTVAGIESGVRTSSTGVSDGCNRQVGV